MKHLSLTVTILVLSTLQLAAQESCMSHEALVKMDASWEQSLKETNLEFFESNLSEKFIWVHNHAGQTDSKKQLLKMVERIGNERPHHWKARTQTDVGVIISGSTGVVHGFTDVEVYNGSKTRYHFMRTYAEQGGRCYLIANHTMAIPENEND